jgi:hypothetical protein
MMKPHYSDRTDKSQSELKKKKTTQIQKHVLVFTSICGSKFDFIQQILSRTNPPEILLCRVFCECGERSGGPSNMSIPKRRHTYPARLNHWGKKRFEDRQGTRMRPTAFPHFGQPRRVDRAKSSPNSMDGAGDSRPGIWPYLMLSQNGRLQSVDTVFSIQHHRRPLP